MDYNNDGKKDLILGEGAGFIKIFLNTNTDANPQFSGSTTLKVANVNKDFGDYSAPYIVDWNNDGKKDVLCGANDGYVYLMINTGSDEEPSFSSADRLINGTIYLDVGTRSAPVVFDWDEDGKKDLLVSSGGGNIRCFINVGTDSDPVFDGYNNLKVNGVNFKCGFNGVFDLADWTNDGMMDVIYGCENTGGNPLGPVFYYRALHVPVPDAKVNGDDGPINVPKTTPLEFKIALDPGSLDGIQCDWWVWVQRDYENWWCQYNGGNRKWIKNNLFPKRFAGAGLRVVNGYKVLGPRTIPAGTWYFRFAVDELNDTFEGSWVDEVEIVTY